MSELLVPTTPINNRDRRIRAYLDHIKGAIIPTSCRFIKAGEWGKKEVSDNQMTLLQDIQLMTFYLSLVEWKTWEKNMFYLECDEDDCPLYFYPADVAAQEILDCLIDHLRCNCLEPTPALKAWGVYPAGHRPEGFDHDYIETSPDPCNDNVFTID